MIVIFFNCKLADTKEITEVTSTLFRLNSETLSKDLLCPLDNVILIVLPLSSILVSVTPAGITKLCNSPVEFLTLIEPSLVASNLLDPIALSLRLI